MVNPIYLKQEITIMIISRFEVIYLKYYLVRIRLMLKDLKLLKHILRVHYRRLNNRKI